MTTNREFNELTFLYEENGAAWYEDDQERTIDIPMNYIGTSPDGEPRSFMLTPTSYAVSVYEDDGSITFIAEEGNQALYLKTEVDEKGLAISEIHIFEKHTKQ